LRRESKQCRVGVSFWNFNYKVLTDFSFEARSLILRLIS
jgi:hypothetical protein